MANENEVALIDLSSIAYPIWHTSQSEPDANKTSADVVKRVRQLTTNHPHAAICCDSGRSFRSDITPTYKANRKEKEAPLMHQIDIARDRLAADGFPIWAVRGFEADDLIASATMQALATPDLVVLIVTGDKDLLQLVGPRVRAMSAKTGEIRDADAVKAKYGVTPAQMLEYLMLVGDKSDNVRGAPGIGEVKAAALLNKYGTLDSIYQDLAQHGTKFTPGLATSLQQFRQWMDETRQLITLRTDVALPFAEISNDRIPKEAATFGDFGMDDEADEPLSEQQETLTREAVSSIENRQPLTPMQDGGAVYQNGQGAPANAPEAPAAEPPKPNLSLAVRDGEVLPAPKEWSLGLDPRSMRDARLVAKDMFESRLFSDYGSPQAVLSTIMVGRELGLPAMAALRAIHIIEGKHALSAALMVALVLKSGFAEYFEPILISDTEAIFEAHRKGARNPVKLSHTIEMAAQAQLVKPNSNWVKIPTDMLTWRCQSRLCRLVFPDVILNLYTPEELREIREAQAA